MEHDVVLALCWVVVRAPPAPVVRHGVGQDGPVPVEAAARDGLGRRLHRLEPLLGVLVPKVVGAVRPNRGKSPIPRVEGDVVHRVNVVPVPPVALESEVGLGVARILAKPQRKVRKSSAAKREVEAAQVLARRPYLHVVDRDPALDGSDEVSGPVREGRDRPRLELERGNHLLVDLLRRGLKVEDLFF